MDISFLQTIIAGSLIAAAGGMMGSFALLRRMALVGDALSHVALPGLALGLLFHFNPFLGAFFFLIFAALFIWFIEHKTDLPVDTLVGIFFTLALAVGALLTPKEDILESLFGDIASISFFDFWIGSLVSLFIIATLLAFHRKFILSLISTDLAYSLRLKPHLLELLFLLLFACTVAIGIRFTGVLLMGSLIIIPAAIARNVASSMKTYMAISAFLGAVGAIAGIFLSSITGLPLGPLFVIIMGLVFFPSLFIKNIRSQIIQTHIS